MLVRGRSVDPNHQRAGEKVVEGLPPWREKWQQPADPQNQGRERLAKVPDAGTPEADQASPSVRDLDAECDLAKRRLGGGALEERVVGPADRGADRDQLGDVSGVQQRYQHSDSALAAAAQDRVDLQSAMAPPYTRHN